MQHLEPELAQFCRKLPKVELHAHLNGSCRDSTLKELVEALPDMPESSARLLAVDGADAPCFTSPQAFLFHVIDTLHCFCAMVTLPVANCRRPNTGPVLSTL